MQEGFHSNEIVKKGRDIYRTREDNPEDKEFI